MIYYSTAVSKLINWLISELEEIMASKHYEESGTRLEGRTGGGRGEEENDRVTT